MKATTCLPATDASGEASTVTPGSNQVGSILQGMVETSNVNPVKEIAEMIKAQRAYEMNSKMIQTADQMMAPSGNK